MNASCPCLKAPSQKPVAVTPLNTNRRVRFEEPRITAPGRTQKKVSPPKKQTTNSSVLPSTGVKGSNKVCGLKPRSNTKNDRILQPSCSNSKQNKV